jgi:hypothetical protein
MRNRLRNRLKQLAKGALRTCGHIGYVERAADYIVRQRKTLTCEVPEVVPIRAQPDACENLRLNLFIPNINAYEAYGGMTTAVKIFEQLGDVLRGSSDIRMRIITNKRTTDESIVDLSKWRTRDARELDMPHELFELHDPRTQMISLSKQDILVSTWWPTAYRAARLRTWQEQYFGRPAHPLIYIIQDFEPAAFYPWSSWYAYAESTYLDGDNTVAIFNSSLLRGFFEKRGYSFLRSHHFEPRISSSLKMHLNQNAIKERRMLVYGRPSSARNCFEVLCEGLREWARSSTEAHRWTIISAGEKHPDVNLGNGLEMRSVGKVSLPEYGALLNSAAIGVSLMLSPHPSYPPLEMAHSGVITITNSFANKDLSSWHENIHSLRRLAPDELAKSIETCVRMFEKDNAIGRKGLSKVPFYFRENQIDEYLYEVARDMKAHMRP